MIRRIFLIFTLVTLFMFNAPFVLAEPSPNAARDKKVDSILPSETVDLGPRTPPKGKFDTEIIPQAINTFLKFSVGLGLIIFTYAGIMLIISQGNEEEVTKFKNILIWVIVGSLFIVVSYGLVQGIMKLSLE